jgi:hypothetical protein
MGCVFFSFSALRTGCVLGATNVQQARAAPNSLSTDRESPYNDYVPIIPPDNPPSVRAAVEDSP